jgi:hypothetical protein
MTFIDYSVSRSSKPSPSCFKKRKYNPLCDADDESISDMLIEKLDIDSDDEMDLEIEGALQVMNQATKCQKVRVKQVLCALMGAKT